MIEKTKKLNVPHQKENVTIKVVLVGDAQSGKSSLVNRYVSNRNPGQYTPTLGVDYQDKHVDVKDTNVHVNIWDFSGKPQFLDIRNEFYKEGTVVLLALDLSNKRSMETCDSWLKQIRENGGSCPILLAGTKSDSRKVEWDMNKLAKEKGCSYCEISTKDNPSSVDQLFTEILNIAL